MHILILVIMWSVIGMAWNLLSGYCGQVSFGHAAFFGVGAYTAGMLYSKLGLSGWWGLPASIVVVALFALVIGYICLRLRGPFFALATLAMGVILRIVAENLVGVTGGDLGIMIRERTWIEKTWYYYIILASAATSYLARQEGHRVEARLLLRRHPRGPGRGRVPRHRHDAVQDHRARA